MTECAVPTGMTAEKLRTIAGWLDTYDRMAEVHWELCERLGLAPPAELAEVRPISSGKQVQMELRQWADAMAGGGMSTSDESRSGSKEGRS